MKNYRRKDRNVWKEALTVEINAQYGKHLLISEMAISLKTFLIQADGLGWQIAINWCLCKWCQLFNPKCINFNHWKEKLATHMSHLNRLNIKNRIDKHKHLHKIWINDYDFDDMLTVLKVIANKFYKEHINDIKQREVVAEAFAQNIGDIINVISCQTNDTMKYVEDGFKVNSMLR